MVAHLGAQQSMGKVGVCWDNAVAESFWSTLKVEFDWDPSWSFVKILNAMALHLHWYNFQRPHGSLDGLTPAAELEKALACPNQPGFDFAVAV